MTTLENRPGSAVLVIDVQNQVVRRAHRRDEVVGRIARLVARARQAGTPVVWVQQTDEQLAEGSEGWQLVPELVPAAGEAVVLKGYPDAFEATSLELHLAELGAGRLVVAGAQTDMCVRSTIHGGLTRGYDVTLVGDAHTTEDNTEWGAPAPELVIAHTNLYWAEQEAPGRRCATTAAEEVAF
ncbi:cysteine hydrolase [Streptomyces tateyamensis]|uniref:Cysteine hydrolase n=1 Tax=Streptomyces tateyamensis TaxID=565073 RepID=A0A2V4PT08_9ACTN|nr:cysteine hydrolase family protein [Streptomyces tateyamensis]PYC88269.1 cysteine hydrolase [Streptomyces tateyamensis]